MSYGITKDRRSFSQRQHESVVYPSAEEIARALGGKRAGSGWLALCPAHGDTRPSLSIRDGHKKPVYKCHSSNDCSFADIQDALVDLGLWPEFRPGERRERPPRPSKPIKIEPTADELRNLEHAYRMWAYAEPWLSGTPAERYLQRRGIWQAIDPADTYLRFARLRHPQTREEKVPCLVVPRHDTHTGSIVACQRIFLTEEEGKYPRKPFVASEGSEGFADAKLSLGIAPDAWSMLHTQERRRWETVERFDEQAGEFYRDEIEYVDSTDRLVLAEGMESALSASILYERPAWAKCSGFPAEMFLPDRIRDVLICADNDPPIKNGRKRVTSEDRAKKLAAFILGTGRRCAVDVPNVEKWDANDVLLAQTEAA